MTLSLCAVFILFTAYFSVKMFCGQVELLFPELPPPISLATAAYGFSYHKLGVLATSTNFFMQPGRDSEFS
jgi:hypothetical protein